MDRSISLRWEHLNLSVKSSEFSFQKCRYQRKEISILNDVSGSLKSGQLVAIMGESGAGKTSLLASISQRIRGGVAGNIYINGHRIDKNDMIKYSSFVAQFDITIDVLTVMEHMYFMTELKLGNTLSISEKFQRIEDILERLNLIEYRNDRIYNLSGGTKKKLSLASELITEPPIIFCDEPTTGLDSFNAKAVITALRNLTNESEQNEYLNGSIESFDMDCKNGKQLLIPVVQKQYRKSVMISIHQPQSQLYNLFTHIVLMHNGRIVYSGSVEETKEFFNNLGLVCPPNYNPADYYVKQVTKDPDNPDDDEAKEKQIDNIFNEFTRTQLVIHEPPMVTDFSALNYKRLNWWHQIGLLLRRALLHNSRTLKGTAIQVGIFIASVLSIAIVCSIFDDPTLMEVQGIFFVSSCQVIFCTSYTVSLELPETLPFIRRENGEKTYTLSAYYVANMIIMKIPFSILYAVLYCSLVCLFAGFLRSFSIFLYMTLVLTMASITANAYGCFISTLFETVRLATEISAPIDLFLELMGGQYKNSQSLGIFKYLSMFFYTNEMLVTFYAQTNTEVTDCKINEVDYCPQNISFDRSIPYHQVLVTDMGILMGFTVFFHLIAYYRLRRYVNRTGFY